MLVLTRYIAQHELKPLRKFLTIDDLLEGAKKVKKGLAVALRKPVDLAQVSFYKISIGKKQGARMIVFMKSEKQSVVPVLIRLKSDKMLGMNMSAGNKTVNLQIKKNLSHIVEDIQQKKFEEFSLS